MNKDKRIAQLEDEVRKLKAQLDNVEKTSSTDSLPNNTANEYQLVKLNLVIEASNIGLWDMQVAKGDPNPIHSGNTMVFSDEFRKMLGYSTETDFPNLISSWSDKLHPDDRERTLNAFERHILDRSSNTSYDVEYRLLRKNGEYGYFRAYGSTVRDENGYALQVAGALKDITNEKKAAEELIINKEKAEENNIRLSLIMDASNTGLWNVYIDGADTDSPVYTFIWSDEFRNILGFSDEKDFPNLESAWSDRLHPDDKQRVIDDFYLYLLDQSGTIHFDIEYRILNKNGEYIHVQDISTTVRDENGRPHSLIGALRDVTELKLAEQKLIDEKERLEMLGNNIPNGALFQFTLNTETGMFSFEYVSARFEKVMGFSAESALNDKENTFAYIHPDDLPVVKQKLEHSANTLSLFDTEHRNVVDGRVHWVHMSCNPRRENKLIVWDGIGININARKEAQHHLKFEKERLKTLGDNIPNGVLFQYTINEKTGVFSFEYVSAQWEEVMGFSANFALNDKKNTFAYVHPDDLPIVKQKLEHTIKTLAPFDFEHRNIGDDGIVRWVHMSSHARRENDIVILDGIAINTTTRKEAELKLEKEKERLERLGSNLPDVALYQFVYNTQTEKMYYTYVSGTWEKITGIPADVALNDIQAVFDTIHPDDFQTMKEAMIYAVKNLKDFYIEVRTIIDGRIRWRQMSSRPRREGILVVADGTMLDITHRKEAENNLKLEKERLEKLGSNIPDGALYRIISETETGKTRLSYTSENWERVIGFSPSNFSDDLERFHDIIHPEDRQRVRDANAYSIKTLSDFNVEFRIPVQGKKSWKWILLSSKLYREEKFVFADGICMDITARKEAELKLELEKERLQAIGDNLPYGTIYMYMYDTETGIHSFPYVSAGWEKVMGYSGDIALNNLEKAYSFVHPDDLQRLQQTVEKSRLTMKTFDIEFRLVINNVIRWVRKTAHPRYEDKLIVWDGIGIDITARKEAQNNLKLEKERLETLGNNIPNGALYRFVLDTKTDKFSFSYVNSKWEEITGCSQEIFLYHLENDLAPEHPMLMAVAHSAETMTVFDFVYQFAYGGRTRWLHFMSQPHHEDNLIIWDGIALNVTERKEAELKLELEHNRVETLGANLPNVALYQFISDIQTHQWHFSYVSGSWESVTGVSAEVTTSDINAVFAVVHPDDLDALMKAIKDVEQKMKNFNEEIRLIVNGQTRWVQLSSRHRRDGVLLISDGVILDITKRKKAERELEYERNRLQTLGDNLPGGSLFQFIRDSRTNQMRISYVSASWETVTGIPAKEAMDSVARLFSSMYPNELPPFLQAIDDSVQTMSDFNVEFRARDRWMHIVSRPRKEDAMIIWDGIIMDVTAKKEAQRALEAEKERLETIGKNFPNGILQRFVYDKKTKKYYMEFLSSKWEEVTGLTPEAVAEDITPFMDIVHPDDREYVMDTTEASKANLTDFDVEIRIYKNSVLHWLRIVSHPYRSGDKILWDGVIADITERKSNEIELALHRENLETMVQERTEELQTAVNDLGTIGEELFMANEELAAANEELEAVNEELCSKNEQLTEVMNNYEIVMKQLGDRGSDTN